MRRLGTFAAALAIMGLALLAEREGYATWESIGHLVIVATLGVLIYQVLLERKARTFEVFRNLLKDYSEILAEEAVDETLADVWLPLDPARRQALDEAQARQRIGAWQAMTGPERRQYWRTRRVLDIFEMAFIARRDLWLSRALWRRWDALVRVWAGTRFFDYVLQDTAEKYSEAFTAFLEAKREAAVAPTQARTEGAGNAA